MRVHLDSSSVLPFLKEKIVSILSQKIILVAAFTFGCFALLYYFRREKVLPKTVTTQKSKVQHLSKTSPISTTEVRKNSNENTFDVSTQSPNTSASSSTSSAPIMEVRKNTYGDTFDVPIVNGIMEGKGSGKLKEFNKNKIHHVDVEFKNDRIIKITLKNGMYLERNFDLDLIGFNRDVFRNF